MVNVASDGKIFQFATQGGLSTDCDSLILCDRLERYELRCFFGKHAIAWDPLRDEVRRLPPTLAQLLLDSPVSSSSSSGAPASMLPLSSGNAAERLPKRQTFGRFRDPILLSNLDSHAISQQYFAPPRSTSEPRMEGMRMVEPQAQ